VIDVARARQIEARLVEIRDELAALAAELGEDADTPELRRRALRLVDGGHAASAVEGVA